jgi:hypothetical protein
VVKLIRIQGKNGIIIIGEPKGTPEEQQRAKENFHKIMLDCLISQQTKKIEEKPFLNKIKMVLS